MHGLQWAEVAPAAPALAELLPPLLILTGLIFALGCIVLLRAFVQGVFGIVESVASHVPGLGGLVGGALTGAEKAVSNALGSAINGIDARIATQFHNLANAVVSLWHHLETSMVNLYDLAKLAAGAATFPDIHSLEKRLRSLIRTADHTATVALRDVHRLEKELTHSVAQGVYPRLRALEHDVTKVIPKEIRSARSLAREAEDGVVRLWDRVRTLEASISTTAIAAVVATALAAVGLDWIGCRSRTNAGGLKNCGLWNAIEDLLNFAAGALLFTNICAFLDFVSPFVSELAANIIPPLTSVGAGLCTGTIGPPAQLPAVQLNLPANPGVTLDLP